MTFMAVLPATPLWVGIILIAAGFVSLILTRGFRRLLASIVLVAGTFACFHSPTGAENAVHSSDTPTGDSQRAAARCDGHLAGTLGGQIEGKGVRKDTAGGQSFRVSRDAILRHDEHGLFSQAD